MEKIYITEEEHKLITEFAENSYSFHRDNIGDHPDRSASLKKRDIIRGKMAEFFNYKKRLGTESEISEPNLTVTRKEDGGFDHIEKSTGNKVDTKSAEELSHQRIYFNNRNTVTRADIYDLFYVNTEEKYGVFLGRKLSKDITKRDFERGFTYLDL